MSTLLGVFVAIFLFAGFTLGLRHRITTGLLVLALICNITPLIARTGDEPGDPLDQVLAKLRARKAIVDQMYDQYVAPDNIALFDDSFTKPDLPIASRLAQAEWNDYAKLTDVASIFFDGKKEVPFSEVRARDNSENRDVGVIVPSSVRYAQILQMPDGTKKDELLTLFSTERFDEHGYPLYKVVDNEGNEHHVLTAGELLTYGNERDIAKLMLEATTNNKNVSSFINGLNTVVGLLDAITMGGAEALLNAAGTGNSIYNKEGNKVDDVGTLAATAAPKVKLNSYLTYDDEHDWHYTVGVEGKQAELEMAKRGAMLAGVYGPRRLSDSPLLAFDHAFWAAVAQTGDKMQAFKGAVVDLFDGGETDPEDVSSDWIVERGKRKYEQTKSYRAANDLFDNAESTMSNLGKGLGSLVQFALGIGIYALLKKLYKNWRR